MLGMFSETQCTGCGQKKWTPKFQKLVTRYCRWRHSDVLINSNLYCL